MEFSQQKDSFSLVDSRIREGYGKSEQFDTVVGAEALLGYSLG
ncbi:hypothetical protein [Mycobacterium leprae]|nr:hypothetical protein [Mycobacterium leprae]